MFANEDHPAAVYERTVADHDEKIVTWACQMGERPPVLREERVLYSPMCAACLVAYDAHEAMFRHAGSSVLSYDGVDVEVAELQKFEENRDDRV